MGIVKERSRCSRELLLTGRLQALIDAVALVLAFALALNPGNLVSAAGGAANAIRPAHLFKVFQALVVGLEGFENVYKIHGFFLLASIRPSILRLVSEVRSMWPRTMRRTNPEIVRRSCPAAALMISASSFVQRIR